ncbi:hypothetical protein FBEOM_292 [Fusarium beomiforme]|uniref:Uncharacterized protein n=1 Tax=Fusarium beomiforme TaxID=44412 RepID=A0A9P5AVG2_9HYPO|nr:hypothetical protein FBEOM_292 [Fusarium beomiforme]
MKLKITLLVLSLPSLGLASVYNDWNFEDAPSDGLDDVTFPISMRCTPRRPGYYFAQQFSFNGIPDVGYAGLQPRYDDGGKQIVHAAFSSFQDGTTTQHENCHPGADGGPGVSCALDIAGDYCHLYNIVVKNIGGTTWRGTLIDTVTGKSDVIGEWTLPSSAGKIVNGQLGFVEYFYWNDGQTSHICSSAPFTRVFFGNPTSQTQGARGGKITRIWEDGECVGELNLKTTQTAEGYLIQEGFM